MSFARFGALVAPSSSESLRTARFFRGVGDPLRELVRETEREPDRERDLDREPDRLLAEPLRLRLRLLLRLTLREPERDLEPIESVRKKYYNCLPPIKPISSKRCLPDRLLAEPLRDLDRDAMDNTIEVS